MLRRCGPERQRCGTLAKRHAESHPPHAARPSRELAWGGSAPLRSAVAHRRGACLASPSLSHHRCLRAPRRRPSVASTVPPAASDAEVTSVSVPRRRPRRLPLPSPGPKPSMDPESASTTTAQATERGACRAKVPTFRNRALAASRQRPRGRYLLVRSERLLREHQTPPSSPIKRRQRGVFPRGRPARDLRDSRGSSAESHAIARRVERSSPRGSAGGSGQS